MKITVVGRFNGGIGWEPFRPHSIFLLCPGEISSAKVNYSPKHYPFEKSWDAFMDGHMQHWAYYLSDSLVLHVIDFINADYLLNFLNFVLLCCFPLLMVAMRLFTHRTTSSIVGYFFYFNRLFFIVRPIPIIFIWFTSCTFWRGP